MAGVGERDPLVGCQEGVANVQRVHLLPLTGCCPRFLSATEKDKRDEKLGMQVAGGGHDSRQRDAHEDPGQGSLRSLLWPLPAPWTL